jgi:exopolyphosphatase/guanosine-5'-triphosphate,3'-diphosphate pyrophosphatase
VSEGAGQAQHVFPLRAAAIDIGSNAMRFVAVEFLDRTRWDVLEQVRSPVRLGRGAFSARRLADDAIEAGVQTLAGYARLMTALDIVHYRAVATSAVRESRNQDVFLARAADEAGIEVEPITGTEEARLVHLAVTNRIDMKRGRWLLADLGGGSVEVSLVDSGRTRWSVSHPMGSVRLLEELGGSGDTRAFRQRIDAFIDTLHLPRRNRVTGFAATGGNIEALADLAGVPAGARAVRVLPLDALHDVIESVARMTAAERVHDLGLREDRADVIVPAGLVYERLSMAAGFDTIHVPGTGLKEGVLLDLVQRLAGRP